MIEVKVGEENVAAADLQGRPDPVPIPQARVDDHCRYGLGHPFDQQEITGVLVVPQAALRIDVHDSDQGDYPVS